MYGVRLFKTVSTTAFVGVLAAVGFGIQGQTKIAIACVVASAVLFISTLVLVRIIYSYNILLTRIMSDFRARTTWIAERRDELAGEAPDQLITDAMLLFGSTALRLKKLRPPTGVLEEHEALVNVILKAVESQDANTDLDEVIGVATEIFDRATSIYHHVVAIEDMELRGRL